MRLAMISAWNDSGGSYLNRLLDGHPALHAWPYELLLGTDDASPDMFDERWFRGRFRWPRLQDVATASAVTLFDTIADSELKDVLRRPTGSKHHAFAADVSLEAWRDAVATSWNTATERSQRQFLQTYVCALFEALDGRHIDADALVLGHCPAVILDSAEIWTDFPGTTFLHVLRGPEAGYRDMKRRHPGLDPARYAMKWSLINQEAARLAAKYPSSVHLVTLERLLEAPEESLRRICSWLGIAFDPVVLTPSWRGRSVDPAAMGPFGGVPTLSAGDDRQARESLSEPELSTIGRQCAGARSLLRSLHALDV